MLVAGTEVLREKFVERIAAAPVDYSPLDAVAAGLDAMADVFAEMDERPRRRQAIIAVAAAEPAATLAAEAGMAVLRIAFDEWTSGPAGQDLHALLDHGLTELRSVAHS